MATLVAASYALGILGPALAFSLERDVSIVHSLSEVHGGSIVLHIHHDDSDHEAPGKQSHQVDHHCCGIFTLAALTGSDAVISMFEAPLAPVRTEPADMQALRRPGRLDRPPRNHVI